MSDLAITGIFIVLMTALTIGYNHIIIKIEKKKKLNKSILGEK